MELVPDAGIQYNAIPSFTAGFLCPVHTPDGAPCGLLNHLAAACQVHSIIMLLSRAPTLDL